MYFQIAENCRVVEDYEMKQKCGRIQIWRKDTISLFQERTISYTGTVKEEKHKKFTQDICTFSSNSYDSTLKRFIEKNKVNVASKCTISAVGPSLGKTVLAMAKGESMDLRMLTFS